MSQPADSFKVKSSAQLGKHERRGQRNGERGKEICYPHNEKKRKKREQDVV